MTSTLEGLSTNSRLDLAKAVLKEINGKRITFASAYICFERPTDTQSLFSQDFDEWLKYLNDHSSDLEDFLTLMGPMLESFLELTISDVVEHLAGGTTRTNVDVKNLEGCLELPMKALRSLEAAGLQQNKPHEIYEAAGDNFLGRDGIAKLRMLTFIACQLLGQEGLELVQRFLLKIYALRFVEFDQELPEAFLAGLSHEDFIELKKYREEWNEDIYGDPGPVLTSMHEARAKILEARGMSQDEARRTIIDTKARSREQHLREYNMHKRENVPYLTALRTKYNHPDELFKIILKTDDPLFSSQPLS